MKILIATDSWAPQVNGVYRTLSMIIDILKKEHTVFVIEPSYFKKVSCPSYSEIKLSVNVFSKIPEFIRNFKPDAIHISTEGPIGIATKIYCDRNNIPYSTSYHTMFPEYIETRYPIIKTKYTYPFFRWFHSKSKGVLVPTNSIKELLDNHKFKNVKVWSRGVDHDLFHPNYEDIFKHLSRPIYINVGRVSQEKNMEMFLCQKIEGTKVVVGDGPSLKEYKKKYPDVIFTGYKHKEELAAHFASSDVFVFPSISDTFGLVNIEAMACGLPVVAFNVNGPKDIITNENIGKLIKYSGDFNIDCNRFNEALTDVLFDCTTESCIKHAKMYTWENCAEIFLSNLSSVHQKTHYL